MGTIDDFEAELSRIIERCGSSRIAILGIGNELKGDDAVGLVVIDHLAEAIDNPLILILNCQNVPENFSATVKRFRPSCVLLIDAADFGSVPGSVRAFELEDLENVTTTTHKASLAVMGKYLCSETDANVVVIGIQPADCGFGIGLSATVQDASAAVGDTIRTVLNRFGTKER